MICFVHQITSNKKNSPDNVYKNFIDQYYIGDGVHVCLLGTIH